MFLAVISITALPAYCIPTIQETGIKFLCAMGGVALSSLIIYLGLTLYNKYFVNNKPNINKEDDCELQEPNNEEDAVCFFIRKNKLR